MKNSNLKEYLKTTLPDLMGDYAYDYLRIWYKINIRAKYLPIEASFWNKPLFVHIPKTAGNSIHEIAEVSSMIGHKSIRYYKKHLPANKKLPPSFSVVRNPYERICSAYHYLKKGGNNPYEDVWTKNNLAKYNGINHFIAEGLQNNKINKWFHFLPQMHFITDNNGNIVVDYILRFENLREEWAQLAELLNFNNKLPQKNVTGGGQKSQQLSDGSKTIVYNFYKDDFLKLGYEK